MAIVASAAAGPAASPITSATTMAPRNVLAAVTARDCRSIAATRWRSLGEGRSWRRWGSNPLPLACHASALPTELRPRGSAIVPGAIFARPVERPLRALALVTMTTLASTMPERRPPEVPLQRDARERDRAALAGPLGGGARLLDAEPDRPARRRPARARRPPAGCSCSTCSRTRAARGCTSATRSASSRTDVYARFQRMNGFNVLHAMGYDAFGLPAEQYAVQTGQHPRVTTEQNIATMKRQLRALGLAHDPRRGPATTDPSYYRWTQWIFLQIYNSWYDEDGEPGPADRRAGRGVPQRQRAPTPDDIPFDDLGDRRAARAHRRVPARVRRRSAGQLVPGPGHGARQRRGHRRRPQRSRQLPRVPPAAEAVDAAHHRVRRPAASPTSTCSTGPTP